MINIPTVEEPAEPLPHVDIDASVHEDWPEIVELARGMTTHQQCKPSCYDSPSSCPYCQAVMLMVGVLFMADKIPDKSFRARWAANTALWAQFDALFVGKVVA